jgi:sigma-B regulation protein RsbU (phosphoserine phosphatase)
MLSVVFEPLLQEYRTRRMARFTVWVLAYGMALWLVDRFSRATGGVPGRLWVLFWICFLPAGGYYLVRFLGFVRGRVLWRLRRRLIVAYVFIAVVPILLIMLLVGLGAFIINGQFAAFLVAAQLREHFAQLNQVNRVVLHEARLTRETSPEVMLDRIRSIYVSELAEHAASYPGLEITIQIGPLTRAFLLNGKPIKKPVTVPRWINREEFAGIVMDDGQLALRSVERTLTVAGELTILLSEPFTPELLDLVGAGIGPVEVDVTQRYRGGPAQGHLRIETPEGAYVQSASIHSKNLQIPEKAHLLDLKVFGASSLDPFSWGSDREQKVEAPVFVVVISRIVTLNRALLSTLGDFSRIYVILFQAVAIVFLVIEGFALIIGIRLTRTMTRTVDNLYDATERVKTGDFSYRIHLPSRDQLSALGEAFDSMTASVEHLLKESQEKLRLESELEIARQVQTQLFPRAAPVVPGLNLFGVCKPARTVSGDYYDFLELGENRVGLVLGDVSGKGISAALLMAAIQSALRAQFYNGYSPREAREAFPISTAQVVARLNRQLYENTPAEKYVTFFYAVYDGSTRKLTYTNAGHLPPVLFRRGRMEWLRTGGTVVGLFSPTQFEQAEIQLEPGDVLLAYTDGITEPENIYGEEFGEARVLEVAQRALGDPPELLAQEIYRSVNDWTGSPELQDDMTLVVAKVVP